MDICAQIAGWFLLAEVNQERLRGGHQPNSVHALRLSRVPVRRVAWGWWQLKQYYYKVWKMELIANFRTQGSVNSKQPRSELGAQLVLIGHVPCSHLVQQPAGYPAGFRSPKPVSLKTTIMLHDLFIKFPIARYAPIPPIFRHPH